MKTTMYNNNITPNIDTCPQGQVNPVITLDPNTSSPVAGPKETVWTRFLSRFMGHKYYANIIYVRGSGATRDGKAIKGQLSCFIFDSYWQARIHRGWLKTNRSYGFVETISFRSRKEYERWNYQTMIETKHLNG